MRALIFDMDSTLVNEEYFWEVIREVAKEFTGKEIPFSFIQDSKNNNLNSNWVICHKFVMENGSRISYEGIYSLLKKKFLEMNPKSELLLGDEDAKTLFEGLSKDYAFFIATSRSNESAMISVNETLLKDFFKAENVYGNSPVEDDTQANPQKAHILETLKNETTGKFDSYVMVGDSPIDITSAKQNGFKSVGVYGVLDNESVLKEADADATIKTIAELPDVLPTLHVL